MMINSKKGQVTIFIIIAILVVAGIILYFSFRGGVSSNVPEEFKPVYDYYLSCLEDHTREGINLLGEQGGYIELPDFEPGSIYAPTSSQLSFFGQGVPYWLYVSGNNILREQVPSKAGMERDLAAYVAERSRDCDFEEFEKAGFDIYVGDATAVTTVKDLEVDVSVENSVTIFRGNSSVIVNTHSFTLASKLGKFYDLAKEIYEFEKSSTFLETYALDVMRLYAPVTGTEIGCAPKIFVAEEIRENIALGLQANIGSLKVDGSYFDLSSKQRDYFVTDAGPSIDENVNFMYDPSWPTKIEIHGDLVAEPVGLQEGLGVLGFCYVPYHFVYDIQFPVLVQFFDTEELFQFPVGVIIDKSQARNSLPRSSGTSLAESKVCEFSNQEITVETYDVDLNPVEAHISFKCLDAVCPLGQTALQGGQAILETGSPQCVNGFLVARAEGFNDAKYQISTNEEDFASIVLSKKYNLSLDLGNVGQSIIRFDSDEYSTTVLYPSFTSVELVEGFYNISVTVFDNSSLVFPEVRDRKCVDVPESGLSGLLGGQTEKCYDVTLPETAIDFAITGGGKTKTYIDSSTLKRSREININVPLFELPTSLEELQLNSIAAEEETIYVDFE